MLSPFNKLNADCVCCVQSVRLVKPSLHFLHYHADIGPNYRALKCFSRKDCVELALEGVC